MDNAKLVALILAVSVVVAAGAVSAQAPAAPPAYGPPITLEQAKKAMASAEAEARKNSWNVVIAIVDSGGNIVMLQRLDDTQFGSIDVARQKAHTAVDLVRRHAGRLVESHPLRAADALQLGAALVAAEDDPAGLDFVTLDRQQALAAEHEGFRVLGS